MAIIPETELIITRRGSVYHLDLHPEEIAPVIITVGDPARVEKVSRYFDQREIVRQHREFITHTGYIGKKRLSVISTGIGTDNIDIVLNEVDALFNIDLKTREAKNSLTALKIIRIGTSGALQADVALDSAVASEIAIGMDNLLNFYNLESSPFEKQLLLSFVSHVQENHIAFIPYIATCSPSLLNIFRSFCQAGITITCPGFYGPQGRFLRALPAYPGLIDQLSTFSMKGHRITNFEMETAGIYGLARILGHEAISLSAIVANRIEKKFSTDPEQAVDRLIRLALEKISSG